MVNVHERGETSNTSIKLLGRHKSSEKSKLVGYIENI